MAFIKATKKKSKLRCALIACAGNGKTFTALTLAKTMGKNIAVIDTERGSASKYAGDVADFVVCELTSFEPKNYIKAMREAAQAGCDVLIIDSLSHAWTGVGGLLDQKDKASGKSSFDAWRNLTPQHNDLIEAILAWPGHVIATMRAKTEYVLEEINGKKVPRKIGMAPVQRDGMEYEFDVVGDLDFDNCLHITKSRVRGLDTGSMIRKPGEPLAKQLLDWLDQGVDEQPRPTSAPKAASTAPAPTTASLTSSATSSSTSSPPQTAPTSAGVTPTEPASPTPTDLDAALNLAEAVCDASDDDVLAWAVGQIGGVAEENSKLEFALTCLVAQRGCQLRDEEWKTTPRAEVAAKWIRDAVEKRQAAKASGAPAAA